MAAPSQVVVHVTPRADADRAGPYAAGVLQVRVTRPPADGEANEAVRALLARVLGVRPSAVTLLSGRRARTKRFAIDGLGPPELARRLLALGD